MDKALSYILFFSICLLLISIVLDVFVVCTLYFEYIHVLPVCFKAVRHLNMYQHLLTKYWKNGLMISQCIFLLPCSTHLTPSRLHDSQGQRWNDFTVLLVCVLCFWGNREIITAARALGAAGDAR